jgi:hypothetical protein
MNFDKNVKLNKRKSTEIRIDKTDSYDFKK